MGHMDSFFIICSVPPIYSINKIFMHRRIVPIDIRWWDSNYFIHLSQGLNFSLRIGLLWLFFYWSGAGWSKVLNFLISCPTFFQDWSWSCSCSRIVKGICIQKVSLSFLDQHSDHNQESNQKILHSFYIEIQY